MSLAVMCVLSDNIDNKYSKKNLIIGGSVLFGSIFVITAAICFFWGSKPYDTSDYKSVGNGAYASGMILKDGQIVKDDGTATTEIPEADMGVRVNKNGDTIVEYNRTSDWKSSVGLIENCMDCSENMASDIMEQIYSETTKLGHACYSISGIKHVDGDLYQILTGTNRMYELTIEKTDNNYLVILKKEVFDVESWVD